MKQYCRYCMNAIDYNGEATDFVCMAEAPCGNGGSGKFYDAGRAKRPNKCKFFEFNGLDVFSQAPDGSFRVYKPRQAHGIVQGYVSLADLRHTLRTERGIEV